MALSADGRITLSAAGQLSGATASLAGKRLVKFCNGELMGKKLKGVKGNVRPHVCMTLTTNVAGEAKLRDLEMEKRDPRTVAAIILGGGAGIRLFPLTKCSAKPAVATQTPGKEGKRWFQGTANTVRQFHWLFEDERSKDVEDVVILSGDHLYRMDYMDFVQNHRQSGADITLSCLPMDYSLVIVFSQLGFPSDFGLMKIDGKGRVMSFSEKPKGDDLKAMAVDTTVLGLEREEAEKKPYIASMGVWRFPTANDFGPEIIPASAKEFLIKAYLFNDYWEDIGTIRSFFEANLALTAHDTVMLGADDYEPNAEIVAMLAEGRVPIGIGENTRIKDCIIDKNARIGKNFGIQEADRSSEGFYIRSEWEMRFSEMRALCLTMAPKL
ncbi:hypothetical protein TEA_023214 [Camellia sinensis var. sinensis]|uniref:glucose-1-phosphate adenylyltransferase n=1 Tax=Camellia sinensis var. sinensis TaxID=542762 RepID=A0A4S4D2Q5_CAMSN|nr:hypothetical protein TEA_023214 [Camellia sinensis var. sinensis]